MLVSSPPQSVKPELDVASVTERETGHTEEVSVAEADKYEHKPEVKPAPPAEPPQPEYHEPQPGKADTNFIDF